MPQKAKLQKGDKFIAINGNSITYFDELQKQLFTYISGGAKSPEFMVDKFYKEKNKKLNIEYINLNTFYKKAKEHTESEDIRIKDSYMNKQ